MVNRNNNFDLNDYKITMNGQELDLEILRLEAINELKLEAMNDYIERHGLLNNLKFEGDIEYTLPKIIPYTAGVSGKGQFKTFTSGNLEGKDYNFIVLFKGEDNKEDYNYILDNLLSHINSQLFGICLSKGLKIGLREIFGVKNVDLICFGIKRLFKDKWRKMFNNNVFYKKFKCMRITFGEIKTSIILSINEFQHGNY